MSLTPELAAAAAARLDRERDRYEKFARLATEIVVSLVRDSKIPATVQSRVKSAYSLEQKLQRYLREENAAKIEAISDEDAVFAVVGDIAGIRIATYLESDRARTVDIVRRAFDAVEVEVHAKPSGYRATHCQVALPRAVLNADENANLRNIRGEIQICSMLGHVWNEVEHSIRYKYVGPGGVDPLEASLLINLNHTVMTGDSLIESLLRARSVRNAEAMVAAVAELFPDATGFESNALDVLTIFVRLGYPDLASVKALIGETGAQDRGTAALESQNRVLQLVPGAEFLLDATTADLLLAIMLDDRPQDVLAFVGSRDDPAEFERIAAIATALVGAPGS